jgi:hypothetical protein
VYLQKTAKEVPPKKPITLLPLRLSALKLTNLGSPMLRTAYLFTFRKEGESKFQNHVSSAASDVFTLHFYPKTKLSDGDLVAHMEKNLVRVYLAR